jgi:hypothetical protein
MNTRFLVDAPHGPRAALLVDEHAAALGWERVRVA